MPQSIASDVRAGRDVNLTPEWARAVGLVHWIEDDEWAMKDLFDSAFAAVG